MFILKSIYNQDCGMVLHKQGVQLHFGTMIIYLLKLTHRFDINKTWAEFISIINYVLNRRLVDLM